MLARCTQKLVERAGPQGKILHPPYRKTYLYINEIFEQTASGYDMEVGAPLVEISEQSDGLRRILDFIDEYEGIARGSRLALTGKEHVNQIVKGNCHLKHPDILGHLHVEIEIVVKLLAKLVDNRCLAHLPCTS